MGSNINFDKSFHMTPNPKSYNFPCLQIYNKGKAYLFIGQFSNTLYSQIKSQIPDKHYDLAGKGLIKRASNNVLEFMDFGNFEIDQGHIQTMRYALPKDMILKLNGQIIPKINQPNVIIPGSSRVPFISLKIYGQPYFRPGNYGDEKYEEILQRTFNELDLFTFNMKKFNFPKLKRNSFQIIAKGWTKKQDNKILVKLDGLNDPKIVKNHLIKLSNYLLREMSLEVHLN